MESTGLVFVGFLMGIVVSAIAYFAIKMFNTRYKDSYGVMNKQEKIPNKKDETYDN